MQLQIEVTINIMFSVLKRWTQFLKWSIIMHTMCANNKNLVYTYNYVVIDAWLKINYYFLRKNRIQ